MKKQVILVSHKCGLVRKNTSEANIQIAVRPVARTASYLLHTASKILSKVRATTFVAAAAAQIFSLKSSVVHG
jgi:hypothetical protein